MTPGPIAINSATFIGYRIAGIQGSILATIGVVLSKRVLGFFLILKILKILSKWIDTAEVFNALRLRIIALILSATLRIGLSLLIVFSPLLQRYLPSISSTNSNFQSSGSYLVRAYWAFLELLFTSINHNKLAKAKLIKVFASLDNANFRFLFLIFALA